MHLKSSHRDLCSIASAAANATVMLKYIPQFEKKSNLVDQQRLESELHLWRGIFPCERKAIIVRHKALQ